jgi:DNA-binding transcriptional regulator WhiA
MKYINFTKTNQITFMREVKAKTNLTWEKIAQELFVSRAMIFFYLNAKSKIPENKYKLLCALANVKPEVRSYIEIYNKTKIISLPKKTSENLAEILGALAGDGHLSHHNYEINITGHRVLDRDYITSHLAKLFNSVFDIKLKIKEQNHNTTIKGVINSKMLMKFLTKEFYIPIGKKKGRLHIPPKIFEKQKLLKAYIRGLFDTDGSVYLRREKNVVVSIISRDQQFLQEVKEAFEQLSYNPCVSGKNLYIYRQKQVKRFFEEIKSSNKKHLERYDNFINRTFVENKVHQ